MVLVKTRFEIETADLEGETQEIEVSATDEPIEVAGKHSLDQAQGNAADIVTIARVTRLGETKDDPETDLGWAPAEDLPRIMRIAYPAGAYHVDEAAGPRGEMAAFMAGGSAPSWAETAHWLVTKYADGRLGQINLDADPEEALADMAGACW